MTRLADAAMVKAQACRVRPVPSGTPRTRRRRWLKPVAAVVVVVVMAPVAAALGVFVSSRFAVFPAPPRWARLTWSMAWHPRSPDRWGVRPAAAIAPGGFAAAATLIILAALCGCVMLAVDALAPHRHQDGLAWPRQLRRLQAAAIVRSVRQTRPNTDLPRGVRAARKMGMHQYGPRLGELVDRSRRELRQTFEDSTIAVAPPRGHKTAAVAIPRVLDAPGPVVSTSTKADLLLNTCTPRARVGVVWVLDAEGIADPMAPSWRNLQWDLVEGCEDAEVAIRRASALVGAKPLGAVRNSDFFSGKAAGILRCWLMAAAVGYRSVRDIPRWLHNLSDPTPASILDPVNPDWAQRLRALPRNTAGEMVGGIVGTLELLLSPLDSPRIAAVCEPPPGQGFDIGRFLGSGDSLYLLTEGQEHGAAPFVTALVDEIMHHARRMSQRSVGQRLDPPLTVVLDEPANTAALPAMPQYMSDSGGRGIALCLLPQGWAQMRRRWGDEGAREIWNSATAALVMGGGKEADFLEDVSRLVGDHRRSETSITSGGVFGGARMSRQRSQRWDRTLKLNDLRQIGDGHALLLYQRLPPAIVKLPTWWKGPQAKQLQAAATAVQASRVAGGGIP